MSDATLLISAVDAGEPQAAEKLLELVYGELRRLAISKMASEAPGHTLQPTALVHEAWLRFGRVANAALRESSALFRDGGRGHA